MKLLALLADSAEMGPGGMIRLARDLGTNGFRGYPTRSHAVIVHVEFDDNEIGPNYRLEASMQDAEEAPAVVMTTEGLKFLVLGGQIDTSAGASVARLPGHAMSAIHVFQSPTIPLNEGLWVWYVRVSDETGQTVAATSTPFQVVHS